MAGSAFAMLALPLSLAVMADPGSSRPGGGGQASAFGSAGASMMAMLGLRSPGERSQGELADTKARQKIMADATPPHQRALAKVHTPTIPLVAAPSAPGAIGPIDEAAPASLLRSAAPTGSALPDIGGGRNPSVSPPGGTGGPPGGPGGGNPPPGPGDNPPPPPPPPPGAVPEPSTWALMMLGIGAIGTSLRKRRRDERAASAGTLTSVA